MDKKRIFWIVIICLAVIGVLIFVNLAEPKEYLVFLISVAGGLVCGWLGHIGYLKYIANK